MANVLSKMKDMVKAPMRYYEKKKICRYTNEFLKRNDIFENEDYCSHCNRGGKYNI